MIRRACVIVIAATLGFVVLVPIGSAAAARASWRPADLESQLMCPTCHVLLTQSESAAARDIRQFIKQRHDAGWTEQQTKDALVQRFGVAILAAPPFHGFDILAWVVPGLVLIGGAALACGLARIWSGRRAERPARASRELDPQIAARIDAELERFE